MKRVLSEGTFLADVKGAIRSLRDIGFELSSTVTEHCVGSYELNRKNLLYSRDPVTHVVTWLAAEKTFLKDSDWMFPAMREVLAALLRHGSECSFSSKVRLQSVSLAARRHLLGLAFFGENIPIIEQFEEYGENLCLPDPKSRFFAVQMEACMPDSVRAAARAAYKLFETDNHTDQNAEYDELASDTQTPYSYVHRGGVLFTVATGKEVRGNTYPGESAATAALSYASNLELASYRLLHDLAQPSIQAQLPIKFRLAFFLQVFYGISYKDQPDIGIREWGAVGRLTKTHLLLKVGSPYYPQAFESYAPSVLSLPVVREIRDLLITAKEDVLNKANLREVFGAQFRIEYQSWCRSFAWKTFDMESVNSQSFHRVWQRVALLDLRLTPTIVGLLRANPLPLTRGASSYVTASNRELVSAAKAIQDRIRENAGYSQVPEVATAPTLTKELHGTPAISFQAYRDRLRENIEAIHSHNEALACLEGFVRLFGPRNLGDPVNPLLFVCKMGTACFEFTDKLVNSVGRTRWIPISAKQVGLLETCGKVLGPHRILPFIENGQVVPLSKVSDAGLLKLSFNWPGCRQVGRTAFFNLLREEGAGDFMSAYLMGHGTPMFGALGHLNLIPVDTQIELARSFLFPLYEKHGIDDLATELQVQLERHVDTALCRSQEPLVASNNPTHRRAGDTTDDPFRHVIQAPSEAERFRISAARLDHEQLRFGQSKLSLAVALALELGIPVENLVALNCYYSAESFVQDRATGRIYFNAIGQHADRGGLFALPLLVCEQKDAPTNQVLRLFMHLFEDRSARARLFPPKMSTRDLGVVHKHLLVTPDHRNSLSDQESYRLLKRRARFTCRRKYAGPVLFALAGGKMRGLNFVAVEDVIQLETGVIPDLVFACDKSSYRSSLAPTMDEEANSDKILKQKIRAIPNRPIGKKGILMVQEILRTTPFIPSATRCKNLLETWGYPAEEAKAQSGGLMSYCRKIGLFRLTNPLRMLSQSELNNLLEKISLKKNVFAAITLLLARCGLRIGELSEKSKFRLFQEAGRSFAFVGGGKTRNAKRWIDLDRFMSGESILRLIEDLREYSVAPDFIEIPFPDKTNTASMGVGRLLSDLSDKKISAHGLRHQFFFHVLQRLLDQSLLHGAFTSAMCSLAVAGGHGSASVGIREYIGTAVTALKIPRFKSQYPEEMTPDPAMIDRVEQMAFRLLFGNLREAENQLRSELSGEAAYISRLETHRRRLSSLLKAVPETKKHLPVEVIFIPPGQFERDHDKDIDSFECILPTPLPGWERHWEKGTLELISQALAKHLRVVVPLHSDRKAFLNRAKRELTHLGARVNFVPNDSSRGSGLAD